MEGYMTGGMQDRWDTGYVGYMTDGIHDRWDT